MSIRLTESRLRQIIREEAGSLFNVRMSGGSEATSIMGELGPRGARILLDGLKSGDPDTRLEFEELVAKWSGMDPQSTDFYGMVDSVERELRKRVGMSGSVPRR